MNRDTALVELVGPDGAAVGATTVAHAHTWPGLLHRAFSVLLVSHSGRMLLQRRAAVKTRFALRWANACCGHPAPGQDPQTAASARLYEELGLHLEALQPVGHYVYRARDPVSGRVEHEYDRPGRGRRSAMDHAGRTGRQLARRSGRVRPVAAGRDLRLEQLPGACRSRGAFGWLMTTQPNELVRPQRTTVRSAVGRETTMASRRAPWPGDWASPSRHCAPGTAATAWVPAATSQGAIAGTPTKTWPAWS